MSQRNSRENKKRRRIAKQMRAVTPVPSYINLIDYIKLRTRCTTGMAKKVILSGSIMVDSHTMGFHWEHNEVRDEDFKILNPLISADLRDKITIVNKVDDDS